MIVVVTIGVPAGLRGDITRWLAELSPGVYVGKVRRRVRDLLWERICSSCGSGGALLIVPAATEQGYEVLVHNYQWDVRDFDGLTFLSRPHREDAPAPTRSSWSNARRRKSVRSRS